MTELRQKARSLMMFAGMVSVGLLVTVRKALGLTDCASPASVPLDERDIFAIDETRRFYSLRRSRAGRIGVVYIAPGMVETSWSQFEAIFRL